MRGSHLDTEQIRELITNSAESQETLWHLVFEGGMSKEEVWKMTPFEVAVAAEALNNHARRVNESTKAK